MLLNRDPSGDFRPALLQGARSHEKADMATRHDLLDDAFLRRADIIFSAEDLIGRRNIVGSAAKEIKRTGNVAEIELAAEPDERPLGGSP